MWKYAAVAAAALMIGAVTSSGRKANSSKTVVLAMDMLLIPLFVV